MTPTAAFAGAVGVGITLILFFGPAGMVAVPAKPSTAMLTAGADAGHVSVENAWRIYLAMVRAAD